MAENSPCHLSAGLRKTEAFGLEHTLEWQAAVIHWTLRLRSEKCWIPLLAVSQQALRDFGVHYRASSLHQAPRLATSARNSSPSALHSPFFANLNNGTGPVLTEAARVIGIFDTIVVRSTPSSAPDSAPHSAPSSPPHRHVETVGHFRRSALPPNTSVILDNATWKGIMSTLTRDLAPSAYAGRSAVVLASSSDDAAAVFFAMRALRIAKIYTVGFRTPTMLARNAPPIEQFIDLHSLQRARSVTDDSAPFVIVSALGPEKSHLVGMLVRAFGGNQSNGNSGTKRVFLDLADGAARKRSNPGAIAEKSGFAAYGAADVAAFTTVESLRLLIGQNVPYSFVRMASGRTMF